MIHDSSKILVTGATGFVGSHLVEELIRLNADVLATTHHNIIPNSYFKSQNLDKKAKTVKIDLCEFTKVNKLVTGFNPDFIFHLAAQPLVEKAYEDPKITLYSNILGTINVLESARLYNCHSGKSRLNRDASRIRKRSWASQDDRIKGIIVASSDKAYGKLKNARMQELKMQELNSSIQAFKHSSIKLKYKETHPLAGDHPYEVSKSSTDLICYAYYKTYGLPVVITRFGNIYGEGDIHYSRLIPGIMKALVNNEVFKIRSNGQFVRDYLYVKDVVRGYVMLAENINKVEGEAFNFGSDDTYSVLSLISLVTRITNRKLDYKILNTQKNEIPYQSLDWSKIKNLFGWKPEYELTKKIESIFNWYQKCFEL